MILVDIGNLNILVLFILAFISFKGYQADDHLFDSESDEELSQGEANSNEKKDNQPNPQSASNNS
jgi:hypothetical protein